MVEPSDQRSGSIVSFVPKSALGKLDRASRACDKLRKVVEVPRREDPDRRGHLLEPGSVKGRNATMHSDH